MKNKLLLLLLCVVSLKSISQQSNQKNNESRLKGLDTALQHVLTTWRAAGFAVAVVQNKRVIYAKGFGFRNIDKKLPVGANTVFEIGSCTKAFTAALIGQLQHEERLDIDQPATDYLPLLKFYNTEMDKNVTLRDMMSHRTGLPRFDLSWYFFNTPSIDSLVKRIQYMEPTAGIRAQWQYNNFMFAAQGAIVQKLTGKSWGTNIKENIFGPLGMTHSDVEISALEKNANVSLGYTLRSDNSVKQLPYFDIGGMSPAGAINSNVYDMAKWVTAWINDGKYNGKQVIPLEYRNQAISSQSIVDGSLPGMEIKGSYFSNYGFGWFVDSYRGHYRVEHGGNVDGFSANTSFFPADSIGIVVLTNQDNSKVPGIVRNIIADRLLHLAYHDWNGAVRGEYDKDNQQDDKLQKVIVSVKSQPASRPLRTFAGSYTHPAFGTMELYVKDDSLFAKTVSHLLWLRHVTYDVFEMFDRDPKEGVDTNKRFGIKMQFHTNTNGDIDGIETKIESGLKPFLFMRQEPIQAISKEDMEKCTGDYSMNGSIARVFIKDPQMLILSIPEEGEFELLLLGDNRFSVKKMNNTVVRFNPVGTAKITDADFITPAGTIKIVKK